MKPLIATLLLILSLSLFVQAQSDTISIYFEIGKNEAIETELKKLDVNKSLWIKADIVSYTDYLGTVELNNKLSLNRSQEIRSRLVQRDLDTEVLGIVEGRGITGKTLDSDEGIQKNRRTDIIIYTSTKVASKLVETEIKETKIEVDLSEKIEEAKIGDHLVMKGLDFIPGQHFLSLRGDSAFVELLDLMRKNESLEINIEGHICCNISGDDGYDMTTNKYNLSEARAEYVYNRLIEEGIDSGRLSFEGFARKKPLFPEELTTAEKQANRRVEIMVVKK